MTLTLTAMVLFGLSCTLPAPAVAQDQQPAETLEQKGYAWIEQAREKEAAPK